MKVMNNQNKLDLKITKKSLLALAALMLCTTVSAQTAGTKMFKLGYNNISPKVSSGDLSPPSQPGTKADVTSASSLIFTGTYMLTDHVSAELYLGLPYEHDLIGAGTINGVGKFASVKQLPPTLFAQYRFLEPTSSFRPYVGLGLTYAMFRNETGSSTLSAMSNPGRAPTTLSIDNAWGITPQVGATFSFNEKWYADVGISKTFIRTTTTLSTGQTLDIKLDPISTFVAIGYRF